MELVVGKTLLFPEFAVKAQTTSIFYGIVVRIEIYFGPKFTVDFGGFFKGSIR